MKRVTIADIAAETGMSVYAVSRALSGKSGVSSSSRSYIHEIAHRMGYISKQRDDAETEVIRFVIPSSDLGAGEHYMSVVAGAERKARELGMRLDIITTNRLEDIPSPNVSGYILAGELENMDFQQIATVLDPVVALFYLPLGTQIDSIMFSDYEAGGLACQHFLSLGHKHLAVVRNCGTNFSSPSMQARVDGFHIEANQHDGVLTQSLSLDDIVAFKERIKSQFESGILPTGFFCVNDIFAEQLVAIFTELKIRVPYDVSVIGFGNYVISQGILPPLTTIQAPMQNMGELGLQQVYELIKEHQTDRGAIRTFLTTKMLERASTASLV